MSRSIVLRRLRNVRVPRKFEGAIHRRLCKLVTYLLLEFDQLFFDLLIHVPGLLQRPASQRGDVTVCEDCLVLGGAVAARLAQGGDHATRRPLG